MVIVSVYMTVRNGVPFIEDAIQSVLNQTLEDIELVIVDDHSTDETIKLVKSFQKYDSRVKLFRNPSRGRASALNFAINQCSGLYLANLDCDDLFHNQKLEIQSSILSKNINMMFTFTESKIMTNQSEKDIFLEPVFKSQCEVRDFSDDIYIGNMISHSSICVRRDALNFFYNEKLNKQIDIDLWFRLSESGVRFYKVMLPLSLKRVHKMQSFENKKRLTYVWSAYCLRLRFLKAVNAPIKFKLIAISRCLLGILPFSWRLKINSILSRNTSPIK